MIKTEEITVDEFQERSKKLGRSIPLCKAEAVVKIFDKDGNLKSTLDFSSEELDDET
ncbi:MAG: hypothetical protein V3V74_06860 [Nitrosomonadaceae bacterium]